MGRNTFQHSNCFLFVVLRKSPSRFGITVRECNVRSVYSSANELAAEDLRLAARCQKARQRGISSDDWLDSMGLPPNKVNRVVYAIESLIRLRTVDISSSHTTDHPSHSPEHISSILSRVLRSLKESPYEPCVHPKPHH